jgi:hypothetical protein
VSINFPRVPILSFPKTESTREETNSRDWPEIKSVKAVRCVLKQNKGATCVSASHSSAFDAQNRSLNRVIAGCAFVETRQAKSLQTRVTARIHNSLHL